MNEGRREIGGKIIYFALLSGLYIYTRVEEEVRLLCYENKEKNIQVVSC